MLRGMIKSGLLLAAGVFIGGILFYEKQKEPCIYNFSHVWLYHMEQFELTDLDETEAEKTFHNVVLSVAKEQNRLYTSKSGLQYIVPSYCYVEESGFFVKLWKLNQ